ncbi:MAG: Gfo/Idh/MocA family oxidoreductase [Armatimonadetes bacterium]|nr:Gfo/Idh/MocA family oxidoreductase [Armatimonadota bacterium]
MAKDTGIRVGVIGYGGAFNMGKGHLSHCQAAGMIPSAVCDLDPARTEVAKADFPGIATYNNVEEFLTKAPVDLVIVITPHNTHADLCIQASNAGKHVITEKPFSITVAEATAMIEAAKKAGKMLSVYHNRRWDGDFMAIRQTIEAGLIGDVFSIEMGMGGYGHPGTWWRADKKISGGNFYDWGAHIIDWMLHIVNKPMVDVTGIFQKRVWMDVTNEDHTQAIVRFEDNVWANVEMSQIAAVSKPRYRILGTKGGILDRWEGHFTLFSDIAGLRAESKVPYLKDDWAAYYGNIAAHLSEGAPLAVTPESARRIISVIETAERSAEAGKALAPPFR